MVRINNSYDGINKSPMDDYIRNLNDSRVGMELSFLPVINYFVDASESSDKKVLLPSKIFEDQRDYLRELGLKYHERDFDFVTNPKDSLEVYDNMTKLIRKSRKTTDYCLLDSIEFMIRRDDLFEETTIPKNVAISIADISSRFSSAKLPNKIKEKITQESLNVSPLKGMKPQKTEYSKGFNKFQSPFQLYSYVLGDIKRTIDFEALKMYDFLLETNMKEVRSNKLLEVNDKIKRLGESEYYKQPYDVSLRPLREDAGDGEVIIDEWSSNLRRLLELKEDIGSDFLEYIDNKKEEKELLEKGVYPDLLFFNKE